MAKQDATVELYYDGQWNTVPVYERHPIQIVRGYAGESRQSTPSTVGFSIDNFTGNYDPSNPMAALWGVAGRNTPCRVTLDGTRFHGEVSSWKPRKTVDYDADTGKGDAWTVAEVSGVLRRLGQGKAPLKSALYRALVASSPDAYWPGEDGSGATVASSAVPGIPALTPDGVVHFATVVAPDGTANVAPDFVQSGAYTGSLVTPATFTPIGDSGWTISGWFRATLVDTGSDGAVGLLSWRTNGTFGALGWNIYVAQLGAAQGFVVTAAHDPLTGQSWSWNGTDVPVLDGEWHHFRFAVHQENATTVRVNAEFDGDDYTNTYSTWTAGDLTRITVGGYSDPDLQAEAAAQAVISNIASASVCGLAVYTAAYASIADTSQAGPGYVGETASARLQRLCTEEGITAVVAGGNASPMGAQPRATLLDLLAECERTDGGLMYEPRDQLAIAYRTRHNLYNQPAALQLDATGGQIAPSLDPDLDDKGVRNDVTVKRRGGASARREKTTGRLSVQDPPDGVGRYDTQVDVNTDTDEILVQHAAWRLHLGTCDETRWPRVTVDLDAAPDLAEAAAAVDVGDVITIDNLNPGQVQLLVLGYTETIGTHRRKITFNCAPWAPWEVWQLDTGGSTLTKAMTAYSTSATLDTSAGPEWSTTDEPYHVQAAGEAMTVTAMATDTITYVGAGTAVHGADGASVAPDPHASTAAGDLMVLFAAVRDTAASVDDLDGWTALAELDNVRVFARYYRDGTGDDDPTVTFTGGGAGDDTTAQIATFRGASLCLDDGAYNTATPSPQTQANASAQDIAYPALSVRRAGCVALYLGWKADDWTSVTSPGDAEIGEPDTTTGDDQGIVWSYDIQTTAADLAAGSFTVTGGASAVSKGITLALRPTQTATVTRSVNDVVKTHTVGEAVTGWRLGAIAL